MSDFFDAEPVDFDPGRVLFVGLGQSAVCWYRCALPAMFMGADWIGLGGKPGEAMRLLTGLVKGNTAMPDMSEYDVVVVQQPRGTGWLRVIRNLQEQGVKVMFEIDDYVHGIRKMDDHDYKAFFNVDALKELELNMRVCDGLICSTDFIAKRYRKFNRNVFVCENGIDTARYNLTRPPRPTVNIGWAGATGHQKGMVEWLRAVAEVLAAHQDTCFVSIGQEYADLLRPAFPTRAVSIPFTLIETYPAAMTMFDIALAPAGKNSFFQGKSDLRWLEAGALGIPIIADPGVYPKIEEGVTGFHASSATEAKDKMETLVGDKDLRERVGAAAKEYVRSERDMRVAVSSWVRMVEEVLEQSNTSSPLAQD